MPRAVKNEVRPRVFLSYGRPDIASATRLHRQLTAYGADVWFDACSLRPGEKWKPAIKRAIRSSRFFLLLLSSQTTTRRGFLNREISEALDTLGEFPESEVFLIPARLDACTPDHERLRALHWLDLFPSWDDGLARLLRALGLSGDMPSISLLDISICGRCGAGDLELADFRARWAGIHEVGVRCPRCDWRCLSGRDLGEMSAAERDALLAKYGMCNLMNL
jgi:hypothetical protein